MKRGMGILAALLLAVTAKANMATQTMLDVGNHMLSASITKGFGGFKVGDEADYNFTLGALGQGTMSMKVTAVSGSQVVINQNISIMGQNQSCDETINTGNGKVEKVVCNGQNQNVPDSQEKVVKTSHETITVPAGTFKCIYAQVQNSSDQSISEFWVDPSHIPVSNAAQVKEDSQLGPVELQLTGMQHGQ